MHALDRGRLDRIHRADGPLAAALASLDQYATARAEYDRTAALPDPVARDHAPQAVAAALAAEVAADRPADLSRVLKVAREAAADAAASALVADALAERRAALANELDTIVRTRADDVAAHLSGQLAAVLTEAGSVLEKLRGITDAADVIAADDADVRAAWQRWPELEAKYEGIRTAQGVLWRLLDNSGRNVRGAEVAFLEHPENADADYLARRGGQRIETATGERNPHPAPWPTLWQGCALRWLTEHPDAAPWVPSMAQLEAAEDRLRGLTRALVSERTARVVRA